MEMSGDERSNEQTINHTIYFNLEMLVNHPNGGGCCSILCLCVCCYKVEKLIVIMIYPEGQYYIFRSRDRDMCLPCGSN